MFIYSQLYLQLRTVLLRGVYKGKVEERDNADLWHVVEVLIDLVITATSIELAPAVLPRSPAPILPQVPVPCNPPVPVHRALQPRRPAHLVMPRRTQIG